MQSYWCLLHSKISKIIMSEAGEKFAQEFVIGFGFLGGIWLKVGVSPEGAIAEAIVEMMKSINPDTAPWISILFTAISIIFFILTFIFASFIGGGAGVIAIILAFIGGFLLNEIGVLLLLIAVIIGLFAPDLN